MPHYDALVLKLCINGFDVHMVLVDPSSAADLLQLLAFKQMKLSLGVLNSAERILSCFNGATTDECLKHSYHTRVRSTFLVRFYI